MKKNHRIQKVIDETPYWLQAAGVPGLSVALLEDGKPCGAFAFGATKPGAGAPITENTVFKAASLTKQALLYAALKTVEAGKLEIDRSLQEYLDKPFPANDPDIARITAYHVLTHTTGWPNWPKEGEPISRMCPLGEWNYSGQGFTYLQTVLEAIWNEPAADYLQRLVLDPLGMPQSSFVWRQEYKETAVDGFDGHGDMPPPWYHKDVNGAFSLYTTASEYARLLEAYFDPEMRRRHPQAYCRQAAIDERLGWSLGWGTAGNVLWQWGNMVGFNAFAATVPESGLGIVVLTNGDRGQRVNREWVNAWLATDLPAFYFKHIDL